jgi:hypothetical protein
MKKIQQIILLVGILIVNSCDFEEFQDDPNRTAQATPGLVLTNMIVNAFNIVDAAPMLTSRMLVYTDGLDLNQYYGWARSGFGPYDQLRQVYKLIEEAERAELPNYIALGKFFRAYHAYSLTMTFGEVPYSEALGGFDSNYQPVYDEQESIFSGILQDLEEANNELSLTEPDLLGDVMFNGDILKWKKAINSFRLRVLMTLSEKAGRSSINIAEQFASIFSNPSGFPIMQSNNDNLALEYFDVAGSRYPYFENQNLTGAFLMEQTFVNFLKDNEDPRLFAIGSISAFAVSEGLLPSDYQAYGGLDGSASFDDLNAQRAAGLGSLVNERYHTDPSAELGVVMGYAELQFILAEAAALGWISGNAEGFYSQGIRANMGLYGVNQSLIDQYLAGSYATYNPTNAIEQINTQKYLTYFFSSGFESYYNQRRTGFPTFSVGEGTLNGNLVPVRWLYPEVESNVNQANLEESLARQFGGEDTINAVMWLLN